MQLTVSAVQRCLSHPCDVCKSDPQCSYYQLGNGVRLCAANTVRLKGAVEIATCNYITPEYLPASQRIAKNLNIRQTTAPNNNYQLAITFPIGLYFEAAPSNDSVQYTCTILDGGSGWTMQTNTQQNVTYYSTQSSLTTINCIHEDYIYIRVWLVQDLPRYAIYVAPECRFLRPITSNATIRLQVTMTAGYPLGTYTHVEDFTVITQISALTPYLSTSVPTGGTPFPL